MNDRYKWRNAINKGSYDAQCNSLTWGDITVPVIKNEASHSNEQQIMCEIINDLSKALLQVEQSVERRFLRTPLGDGQKTPDKQRKTTISATNNNKNDETDSQSTNDTINKWQILWNWEKSLMNCTSLSQLFLHIQTLDESIAWSKSALNARCRLCRKKGDAEKMLLCDKCDRGHHMYCLRPRLKVIPDGEWFCPDCKPKIVEKTPRKMRKSFIEDDYNNDATGDDDELYSDENDDNINNDESNDDVMDTASAAESSNHIEINKQSLR